MTSGKRGGVADRAEGPLAAPKLLLAALAVPGALRRVCAVGVCGARGRPPAALLPMLPLADVPSALMLLLASTGGLGLAGGTIVSAS